MSNQVATIEVSSALTWNTKSGKGKSAASQTLRMLAPLAQRKQEGARNDLFLMQRGVYQHVNADIISNKSGKDYQALELMGLASLPANANKEMARHYFGNIAQLWKGAKGTKGALAATCAAFCDWVDAKPVPAPLVIENEAA